MKTISTILLLSILILACSSMIEQRKETSFSKEAKFAFNPTGVNRLYIIAGQSNAGNDRMNYCATGIQCWNYNWRQWDSYMSIEQFNTYLGGFSIPLAKSLKAKYPNDNLYFYQFHKTATSLYLNWDASTGTMFATLLTDLQRAMPQIPTPDEINFIWVQGEGDAVAVHYLEYLSRETHLFDSLSSRYPITRFLNYQVNENLTATTTNAKKDTINAHKRKHAKLNPKVITIGKIPLQYYNSDLLHLDTIQGIKIFRDSLMKHL